MNGPLPKLVMYDIRDSDGNTIRHGLARIVKTEEGSWTMTDILDNCIFTGDYADVDPTSALSVGNATRRKIGLPLLKAQP